MRRTLLLLMFGSLVSALSYGQKRVLTFEEAVKIGMRNNVLLNTQKNNLELSQMQKVASITGIAPSISFSGGAYQVSGNSFNQQAGRVINGIRDNVNGTLSANLNLFSGFNRINSIRQYWNLLDAQSYFVSRTAQDAINTVSNQYLTVMLDVELLKIAKENFDVLTKQLEQVQAQVEVGAKSPVDQYNQDALTKAAELKYVQAGITLDNDKALLAQTLLMDAFEEFDVELPNWDVNQIGSEQLNPEDLAEKAKQLRGDYQRAVKQEDGLRYATKAAKGLMMPSLGAFFNYGSAYNFQHGVPKQVYDSASASYVANTDYPRPFAEQFRTNNVFKSYGFQLNFTVFNGLQNRVTYVQQRVLYQNAQVTRKNVEFQIRNDVVRTVRNYEGAKRAFAITVEQLKAADIAYQYETERYNVGITSFVDFTNANRVLVQAQTDKAQAEYKLVFQKILLQYAVGSLKSEDVSNDAATK